MPQALIDNRYVLGDLLGSGGMAEVYLAHDEVLDRDVALKMLREQYAQDEAFVERFRHEAQSAAGLIHSNIVSTYDRGRSEDGAYYIAMEHVPRGTLKERITRDGALTPGVAAGVTLQIADALSAAHENGVIHRDIKPQNVLITKTGDVKVTDFGIARAAASPPTSTSAVLGTAGYMSPEQATGKPVGPQSDLYSLGVVLYEMLTGKLPYTADNPVAQAMMHVNEPPRSPKEANPTVPEALDALTLKLLAKNPEDRYASAAELRDDLEQLRSGLPPAAMGTQTTAEMIAPLPPLPAAPEGRTAKTAVRPPAAPTRSPDHGRRRRRRIFLALAALLLGLALLGGLTWTLTQGLFGVGSVEVPSLEGLTREEAQEHLAESDLIVGDADDAPSDSVPEGTVVEQAPQAGAFVDPETSVNITLSSGPKRASVPDLTGLSLSEAEQTLSEASFKLGRQDEAPSDTVPVSAVISQDPIEGTEVEEGAAVDVVVSTGPQQQVPAVQAIPAPARPEYDEKAAKKAAEEQKKAAKVAEKQQKDAEKKGKGKAKKKKN